MSAKADRAGQAPVRTLMHALEPRIMFDGAGLATGFDLAHAHDAGHGANSDSPEMAAAYAMPSASPGNEIVFVDTRVPDYQAIVSAIGANVEVVLLDTGRDGVDQIAEALGGRSGIDAIHLVSHGEQGLLALGNGALHGGNLDTYAEALATIGAALAADGDILLYGCDVAGGETGADFIASLAAMTGADVAASDDLTGNAAKGGDWTLEASTGTIEATGLSLAGYTHVLANGTLTFANNTGLADGVATDGDGGSTNLAGIDIEIRNISDTGGTSVGSVSWLGPDFMFSSDPGYGGLTYGDEDYSGPGTKGMSIKSADGAEFQIDGFTYYNWGETQSATITVKGYRDDVEVASMSFEGWAGTIGYSPIDVSLDSSFDNVDDVRLYISAGGYQGDSATNHSINDIIIADAVAPTPVTLAQGDIVVGGMDTVNDDVILVTTADIPAGTVIYITDKGWDQATGAFTTPSTGDGVITWTVSSTISAGTVLNLSLPGSDGTTTLTNVTTSTSLTADIAVSGYTVADALLATGDQIFIYQGSGADPFFVTGFNNSAGTVDGTNWNTSIGATLRDSMLPDGTGSQNALVNGTSALGVPGGASQQDNVYYIGPTSATDRATWLSRLLDVANWGGDGTGAGDPAFGTTGGSQLAFTEPTVAPTLSATPVDPAFTENGGAVDLFSGVTALTNDDGQTFSGMTLTVSNVSNGTSEILTIGGTQVALNNGNTGTLAGIGSFSVSVVGGTATVTLSGMTRDNTQMGLLIDGITYRNASDDPGAASRVVTITGIADSGAGNNLAAPNIASTVTITPVNDAPVLTATGGTPTYTEGGSMVDLFSGVNISTIESGQTITGLTLTVSNLANGANEILSIDGTAIALTNGNSGTTIINGLDYSVSVFGGTATVTLGKAMGISVASAQTVVDGMAYSNTSDNPGLASRVVTLASISDSGGTANGGVDTTSVSIAATVTVVAVNDAPLATTSGGTSAHTEGGAATIIDPGLTLSDPDNSTLASATVSITGNFQSGQDTLSFVNDGSTMGNITASYNAGTGVMTLTSASGTATLAQWQAALRSVTYANFSDAPNTADRTITFIANDGTNDSTPATKTLTVAAVNDAPTVTLPASIAVTEDTPTALTGFSFADVDAGPGNVTVTLSVASGTLAATSDGGVIVGGTASALTLTGSIANINSYIAGSNVSFTTASNATADVILLVYIDDRGNTGSGDPQSDSGTIVLNVTAVNDAPTISAPGSIAITEDVAGALTGISFSDIDAGSGTVTVTFSVPSGTLSATSDSGVIVGGTASALTLTGSIADINAFIAANAVSFTTATNATANVTLTVLINDGGNTGSGGAQTDTTNVTLTVTAVNDAPVNTVPDVQSVDQDGELVFSSGNGNQISISDVDAGGNSVMVTLTATNGLLTLSGTSGLSFLVGNGSNNATMTFDGSIADINNALNGMVFTPSGGYSGPATLQITTNDQGSSGSGGAQTDTDTISITVDPLNPKVTNVTASTPDGIYKVGDLITVTMTFDQAVIVTGGVPELLLETGAVDRIATYISGSGGNTLTFSYTVQAGDISADLDYQSTGALSLNGATIRNAGDHDAILTLPPLGSFVSLAGNKAIIIDGVAATVSSVSVPVDDTYVAGEHLDFTLNLSESVTVDTSGGTPRLAVTLDTGGTVYADYISGSGTSALVFRLTVATGQLDTNGISLGAVSANGGTLRDVAGNDTNLTLNNVGATSGVLIDAVAPTATVTLADHVLGIGETTEVTITFSEAVTGLTLADITVGNGNLSGLSTADGGLTWTATFAPAAAIEDTSNVISVDMSAVQDLAGNQGAGAAVSANYGVDTVRPTASIAISDTALRAGETALVTISFSEAVSGLSAADFVVPNGTLSGLSTADGGLTWTATLTPSAGVVVSGNAIQLALSGITDNSGNSGTGTTLSPGYAVDTVIAAPPPPAPPLIAPPAPPPVPAVEPAPPMSTTLPVMSYGPTPPPLTTLVPVMSSFSAPADTGGAASSFMAFESRVMTLSIPSGASLQPGETFSIGIVGDVGNMGDMTFELRAADGSSLPDWVNFDPASGTISGQVPDGFTGTVRVQIIITDDDGRTIIRVIELSAGGAAVNDEQAHIRSFPLPEAEGRQDLDALLALHMGISSEQTGALLRGLASAGAGRG